MTSDQESAGLVTVSAQGLIDLANAVRETAVAMNGAVDALHECIVSYGPIRPDEHDPMPADAFKRLCSAADTMNGMGRQLKNVSDEVNALISEAKPERG